MELIELLTSNLGIQEDQAKGGAGLLFKLAKEKLGEGDFSQVEEHVPDVGQLISAAPKGGGLGGAIGGMLSKFGGGASQLGGLASLAGGFSKVGLDTSMIGKFIPVVLSFVQSKGGDGVKGLLEKVLK
jgi:hypothetical protein